MMSKRIRGLRPFAPTATRLPDGGLCSHGRTCLAAIAALALATASLAACSESDGSTGNPSGGGMGSSGGIGANGGGGSGGTAGGSGGATGGSGGTAGGSGGATGGSGGTAGGSGGAAGGSGGAAGGSGGATGGSGGAAGGSGGATGGSGGATGGSGGATGGSGGATGGSGGATGGSGGAINPGDGPPAGNPNAEAICAVPAAAGLADVSNPSSVVGTGTPASCTSSAFVNAVAGGGIITFNCGHDPVTITLDQTAKVFNNTGPEIVIDGGGLVTLSGAGQRRILYMNTCDPNQVWTTSHCDNQDHPRLTVQNITFIDGNSKSETEYDGGGEIWVRGGRFKVVNSRFFRGTCADAGPDVGGAAIRVFDQYNGLPVYVVNSTFGGGAGYGGVGSNGGGISSIGVSWTIINSLFSHNRAIGEGGSFPVPPALGGGSGGAIYNDGNTMTLSLCGTRIEYNEAVQHGSAIFFVTNNHTGNIRIEHSVIENNTGGSWYPVQPQISCHDDTPIEVIDSVIQ